MVFPNENGKPDGHFLRKLKAIATKVGVEGAELHRFRKTYADTLHEEGVSVAKGVIPIVGVRDVVQLREVLQATDLELTNGQIEGLNSASAIPLGYPHSVSMHSARART